LIDGSGRAPTRNEALVVEDNAHFLQIRAMSQPATGRAVILEFLETHANQACFSSEVWTGVRDRGVAAREVEAHLRQLHDERQVWLEEFTSPDPHLPSRILVASAIDRTLALEQAQEAARSRVHRAFDSWLREFLMTHRCTG
jgi:hypothetical protein